MTDASDYVLVNGAQVPIDKSEHTPLIQQTANDLNCSVEEAWEHVKHAVVRLLMENPRAARKGGRKETANAVDVQPAVVSPAPKPVTDTRPRMPRIEVEIDQRVLHLNGAPANAIRELDRGELGLGHEESVVEAITSGKIKLADEHPDVSILRAASPRFIEFGAVSESRRAAMETIHQRQYRFPFHSDTVRIMATDLNKTSLFHVASNNTARRFCRDEPLGRIGETVSAVYRGEELRHDDELVLMQLMQVARGKYPYEWFSIFSVPFFKGSRGVTRRASSKDIDSVMESLARMRGGYLVVKSRSNYITVNLIKDLAGSGSNHHVQIDPALIILYSSFTALDTDHLFKTSGVARQLLKYISTIPSAYEDTRPIKITSLFELCYGTLDSLERHYRETNPGKTDAQVRIAMSKKLSDFRRKNLPAGLDNLKEMNIIRSYKLDESTDKVVINRNPDASPVRVLAGPSA
ncbi:hypothetical protein LA345_37145 (plasmid) [Burkholderia vietnamiensis]|uniref:Uncharacterized protein n=1 Tax=Burkholderia vietnamiensis (strain G4 / LMG 22486) TaxID=269482 RepID=A4JVF1_BURVG|nr:hypothetical protein Bcep1808_7377 [Burkholderia vietnamiensis G4]MCB4349442.1 hypothetical protein [Burkholderia vietnamiensis]